MNLYLETDSSQGKKFKKGEVLFKKGATAKNIYILKQGTVICFVLSPNKRVVPVQAYKDSGVFGEDGVLAGGGKYAYFAVALSDCRCTVIPDDQIKDVLDASSDWVGNILENISARVHQTVDVLGEHRILDEKLNLGTELSQEVEKLILNSITD